MDLNRLPKELLLKVFSYLSSENIMHIRRIGEVCRDWYQLSLNSLLWMHINLAYKRVNFDRFLVFQIRHNLLSNLAVLNLHGAYDVKHEQLIKIIDNVRFDCLKVLDISNCKHIKSSVFVKIADKFKKLEELSIQSIIKNEVLIFNSAITAKLGILFFFFLLRTTSTMMT